MKSCLDCFKFKAVIPVVNGQLMFDIAKAYCSEGMLTTNDRNRYFKDVLRTQRKLQIYETADKCFLYDAGT